MKKHHGLVLLGAIVLSAWSLSAPAASKAVPRSACETAAVSAKLATDAIVASATALPDDAAALMSCIFPLMPEQEFRAAALNAASGVKNAELGKFIIEVASNLLLKATKLRAVPDRLPAVEPTASPN